MGSIYLYRMVFFFNIFNSFLFFFVLFLHSWVVLFYFYYFYSFYLKIKYFFIFFGIKFKKPFSIKNFLFVSFLLNFFNFTLWFFISMVIYLLWFFDHEDILILDLHFFLNDYIFEYIYLTFLEYFILNSFYLISNPLDYQGILPLYIIIKYYF